nr:class 1b ribonucleoside-diphosphate reductase subunit beta [Tomitella gaofuii]
MSETVTYQRPINWNDIQDPTDLEIWNRATSNFWLPEKIALSNDIPGWDTLTKPEQLTVMRVFTGLTMLDTAQGTVGCIEMIPDANTQHEEAILCYFAGMEAIHARSYSSIFSTLANSREIDGAFTWSETNEHLQNKARIILSYYRGDCPLRKKVISVLLESFLFYSGFYLPFWYAARGKLTNTADIIRLILRDEVLHGFYIGHKFRQAFEDADPDTQQDVLEYAYDMLSELYDNECLYAADLYDHLGWTDDVKAWMRLNANRALKNLGFEPLFADEDCQVSAEIMTNLDPGANETHDFFSGSGSSYVIGRVEETTDDDWN